MLSCCMQIDMYGLHMLRRFGHQHEFVAVELNQRFVARPCDLIIDSDIQELRRGRCAQSLATRALGIILVVFRSIAGWRRWMGASLIYCLSQPLKETPIEY